MNGSTAALAAPVCELPARISTWREDGGAERFDKRPEKEKYGGTSGGRAAPEDPVRRTGYPSGRDAEASYTVSPLM